MLAVWMNYMKLARSLNRNGHFMEKLVGEELGEVVGDALFRHLMTLNDREFDLAAAYLFARFGTIEDLLLPGPQYNLVPLCPHTLLDVYRMYSGVTDAEALRVGTLAHGLMMHDSSRMLSSGAWIG